jgi:hypothetical protein
MRLAFGFFVLVGSLLAADAGMGTWKLNAGKSKFNPGPPPKSVTMTYEQSGNGVKRSGESVSADGRTSSWGYTANYDGKDYPVEGNPNADTIALKQVNDRTVEATIKKGGKVVTHARRVVSADGKTMTLTIKGMNDQGQKVDNVQVYDKQ